MRLIALAVVVLPVDTSAGDSTRAIIQRDFDFGDRMQPLILDSATLDDIWRPGQKNINFAPLAQTRANFVVRARPTAAGLHVEVYDVPRGRLRQEDYFRLPKVPAYRLPAMRDSLSTLLGRKAGDTVTVKSGGNEDDYTIVKISRFADAR